MQTSFPFQTDVHLVFSGGKSVNSKIHVRIPSWAIAPMEIKVNNSVVAIGKPGTYIAIDRKWSDNDVVSFNLPIGFKLTKYTGSDFPGKHLYALEYGPILMAALGTKDALIKLKSGWTDNEIFNRLTPSKNNSLHFSLTDSELKYIPCWQVGQGQHFTCFTDIESC